MILNAKKTRGRQKRIFTGNAGTGGGAKYQIMFQISIDILLEMDYNF